MEDQKGINHAVRYDSFGGTEVLYIAETPIPEISENEVLVKIKAAGINPGEAMIRAGAFNAQFPSTFPSGQGSDFAGIVVQTGAQVKGFATGDEVIGFTNDRNSQAEYIAVDQSQLVIKPAKVSWEQGGGLFVAGTTAYAGIKALSLSPGDLLIIAGAAGGVGSIAVQIARSQGAEVIGFAGTENHHWLKQHGAIPVAYGQDNLKAIRQVLDGRSTSALFDASGKGYVKLGIDLGIPTERINTIIDFKAASIYGVKTVGSAAAATAAVLGELASMINEGKLQIPIAATFPLTQVKAAYDELEKRHTHGKIVLVNP